MAPLTILAALIKFLPTFERWGDALYTAWVEARKREELLKETNKNVSAIKAANALPWSCPLGVTCPLNPNRVSDDKTAESSISSRTSTPAS